MSFTSRSPMLGIVMTTISPPDFARTSLMMALMRAASSAGMTFAKSLMYPRGSGSAGAACSTQRAPIPCSALCHTQCAPSLEDCGAPPPPWLSPRSPARAAAPCAWCWILPRCPEAWKCSRPRWTPPCSSRTTRRVIRRIRSMPCTGACAPCSMRAPIPWTAPTAGRRDTHRRTPRSRATPRAPRASGCAATACASTPDRCAHSISKNSRRKPAAAGRALSREKIVNERASFTLVTGTWYIVILGARGEALVAPRRIEIVADRVDTLAVRN